MHKILFVSIVDCVILDNIKNRHELVNRKFIVLFYFTVFFALFSWHCPAISGEAMVNSQVVVNVTGKDAADAKAQAMAKAEIDALTDLLNKLAPSGMTNDIIASLDSRKISKMVISNDILSEKVTGNTYQGNFLVTFDGDELSSLINNVSTQLSEGKPSVVGSFLIIPVYLPAGGKPALWEDENPWRDVWKNIGLEITSGDIIVPYGDASDSNNINSQNYETIGLAGLTPLTIRYGVSDIVIVSASLVSKPDLVLTVTKKRIARGRNELVVQTYRADPQETRDLLLARAARDIVYGLQHKKSEELATSQNVAGGEHNKIMMLATISTMDTWTKLREKLSTMPMVDRIETLAISARQVDMVVHYRGSPDSLARAIKGLNIKLVQNKDYWIVSRD